MLKKAVMAIVMMPMLELGMKNECPVVGVLHANANAKSTISG